MRIYAEKENLSLSDCYGYSDSMSDLPMLSVVGHPTAVNPRMRRRLTWRALEIIGVGNAFLDVGVRRIGNGIQLTAVVIESGIDTLANGTSRDAGLGVNIAARSDNVFHTAGQTYTVVGPARPIDCQNLIVTR